MSCQSLPLTLSPTGSDMPLQQAIYSATQTKIYACRGPWVYSYNATTGALISSFRFSGNAVHGSSIVELGTNLYVGVGALTPSLGPLGLSDPTPLPQVFQIALPAMNAAFNLGMLPAASSSGDMGLRAWEFLSKDALGANFLYGMVREASVWRVDPTNIPGLLFDFVSSQAFSPTYQFTFPHTISGTPTNIICMVNGWGATVWLSSFRADSSHVTGGAPTDISGNPVGGGDYDSVHDKVYLTTGNEALFMLNVNEAFATPPFMQNFTYSTLHTARANSTAIRCKYVDGVGNPFFGKLLIAGRADDTVLVWNTATNNVADMVVKTGFTSPIDIVLTPTKAFAVQDSPVGLKEIV